MITNTCAVCGAKRRTSHSLIGTNEACVECGNRNWQSPVANENTIVAGFAVLMELANDFKPDPNIMALGNEARCPECGAIRPLGVPCPTGADHRRG